MIEKNIFNIALSCSLVWHLVGGQAVTIVWPTRLSRQQFATVNFWGSILESVDYNSLYSDLDKPEESQAQDSPVVKNRRGSTKDDSNIPKKESIPLAKLSAEETPKVKIGFSRPEQFSIAEQVNGDFKRSVLVKPELPEYPEWAKELGTDFEVELRFLVLPDGTIGTVDKVTSSGYPELDEIGVRYIRKWKFMALPDNAVQDVQWASIKLIFKIK